MTYVGGTIIEHGDDCGDSPVVTLTLPVGEHITVIYGRSRDNIDSIGFITNKGKTYGPWGGAGGSSFRLEGPVYGFYGGKYRKGQYVILSGLGTWTEPSPTPAAPSSPTPPPVLDRKSPMFGSQSNLSSTWDDRAAFTGQCPSPTDPINLMELKMIS